MKVARKDDLKWRKLFGSGRVVFEKTNVTEVRLREHGVAGQNLQIDSMFDSGRKDSLARIE